MADYLRRLFETSDFPARWHCGNWSAGLGWLHILSDLGVWSAYVAIPCVLGYFLARNKTVPFRIVFVLFGAFILACSTTHLMDAVIFWWPAYRLDGVIKLVTALISWGTVFAIVRITPQMMSLRSTAELEAEINRRQHAEACLLESRAKLETLVQKRTQALQESEERHRMLVALHPDALFIIEGERIVFANHAASKLLGWGTPQELIGRCHLDNIQTDFRDSFRQRLMRAITTGKVEPMAEEKWLRTDGTVLTVEVTVHPFLDQGRPQLQIVARDVTQSRQLEEAVRTSEERFRIFVGGVKGYGIYLLDPQGRVASWNSGAEDVKGYSTEEIIGSHFSRFYTKEDNARGWPEHNLNAALETGGFEEEGWRIRKDGSKFWASVVITALRSESGELRGFSKVARDLTERKRSEERFRAVVEAAPNGLIMFDLEGNISLVNAQITKMFGYAGQELINQSIELLVPEQLLDKHPACPMPDLGNSASGLQGDGRELVGRRKDGSEFPVEVFVNPIPMDEGQFVLASIIDVTERHRSEGEYRRLAGLLDQAYDPILAWTIGGTIVFWNRSAEELYGYSKSEAIGKISHQLLQTIFPDDMTSAECEFKLSRDELWEGELIHTAKDGRKIIVESRQRIVREIGHSLVLEANRDIRKRKQTEAALRDTEARFRQLADTIPQLAWMAQPDGHISWYNKQWYDYTGATAEDMVGWGWQSVHDPAVLPSVMERWRASIATGQSFEMVFPLRGGDGQFRTFLTRVAPLCSPDGGILQWFGTNTDITEQTQMQEELRRSQQELQGQIKERIQAEELLRVSERTYRAIGESIDYGVWICDPDGKNIYASPSFLRLVGLTQEECSAFGWSDALHPDDAEQTIAAWKECIRVRGVWDIEHRFRGVDGQWHPILARGVPVEDEAGNLLCWAGINLDIRARKLVEESLQRAHDELEQRVRDRTSELTEVNQRLRQEIVERRATEAQLREHTEEIETLMDVLPIPVWISHDPECRKMTGNQATYDLTRLATGANVSKSAPPDEVPDFRVFQAGREVPSEDLPMQQAAAQGREVGGAELDLLFNDGSVKSIYGFAAPLFDSSRRVRGCIGAFVEITEMRKMEKKLRMSLQEKELLLKEIHHRVKNNLQIVSTLLDLQSGHTEDPQALEMFKETRGRVRSMALIHERLYRSQDLAHVNFADYVQQLADDMYQTYRASNVEIILEIAVDVPHMTIDLAIPCGLLINELMSNALKHAFANADKGRLLVKLSRSGDTNVLTVADDGVGFPAGIDFRNTLSFGLQLVITLVEQLNGEIELKTVRGTEFTVTFPDMR